MGPILPCERVAKALLRTMHMHMFVWSFAGRLITSEIR